MQGGPAKNAGALKPLVERRREGEGGGTEQRRGATVSINHFQDQVQPLGRVPGNRSEAIPMPAVTASAPLLID